MTTEGTYSAALVKTATLERLEIEADEPPIKRVLDTLCHNELARAIGEPSQEKPVRFLQRLFANFFDFRADRLTDPETSG